MRLSRADIVFQIACPDGNIESVLPSFIGIFILAVTIKLGILGGVSMDRDEILAQSRLENRRWDECERRMADEAGTWGIIAVAAAVVCVFLIRMFSEGGNPYDLLAILFVYLAAANAYKWNKTRSRWTLLVTMLYAVIAIGSLCAYAIAG